MNTDKKMVSIIVPIYNEVEMVEEIFCRVKKVFDNLYHYNFELVFFDDGSVDGTQKKIEELSLKHNEIKGVFYTKNFGYLKNTFYSMQQAKGECAILLHADLQNPPEMIPEFIKKWEKGAQVVLGVKNKSKENKVMYFLRTVFYFLMIYFFGVKLIPHATEFELFDKSFIEILNKIEINKPFLRGIVIDYAEKKDFVYYTQDARKRGKSKFNINKYYEFAICGITQYSKKMPRRIIALAVIGLLFWLFEGFVIFLPSLIMNGIVDDIEGVIIRIILFTVLFSAIINAVILEYIISVFDNFERKPFVVEKKRINY